MAKVLFVGESWSSYGIHIKGFNAYYTGGYEEGGKPLLEALSQEGHEVTYLRNHEATDAFPNSVEELRKYDVVIFSDVGADTFLLHPDVFTRYQTRPNPLSALVEYVAGGGGFLMVGGYMSFSGFEGKANYHYTPMANVLPVKLAGHDDRVERPEGCVPTVALREHAILSGLPDDWPHFLGYNKLFAKDDAQILLSVGGDPFLVVTAHGAGHVAAFASDCAPHWGSPSFVSWESYPRFWSQLVNWLAS